MNIYISSCVCRLPCTSLTPQCRVAQLTCMRLAYPMMENAPVV